MTELMFDVSVMCDSSLAEKVSGLFSLNAVSVIDELHLDCSVNWLGLLPYVVFGHELKEMPYRAFIDGGRTTLMGFDMCVRAAHDAAVDFFKAFMEEAGGAVRNITIEVCMDSETTVDELGEDWRLELEYNCNTGSVEVVSNSDSDDSSDSEEVQYGVKCFKIVNGVETEVDLEDLPDEYISGLIKILKNTLSSNARLRRVFCRMVGEEDV